ncbi:MAG TPA: hypothetical protein VIM34_02605, partial [Burkholderiaceae bacterium]
MLHEADDVGGVQRTESDALDAEAMDEKVAGDGPVVANRRGGQTSLSSQVLREAGHQHIGRDDDYGRRSAQTLPTKIAQQLPNGIRLVATWRG